MGWLISSIIACSIMMALMYIPLSGVTHTVMPHIMMVIATMTVLGPGILFFACAYESIKNRIVNMCVLISLGILAAYVYGNLAAQGIFAIPDHAFFMTSVMLVTFSHIGEYMDERVRKRADLALRNSMKLKTDRSPVLTEEKEYMDHGHFRMLIDKISHISVLIAIGLSFVTFVCWYFFFYHLAGEHPFLWALKMSIAVLVIACPCSLCWVTPAATLVASRKGLKHSIIVKHSAAFEKIARLHVIIFDIHGLKQEEQDAIVHLKRMNMKVVVIAEDREQMTKFAEQSGRGADEYYNRISSNEKKEIIERFQRQGMRVGVVNNSGSDVSLLTQSDAGIILGTGMNIPKRYGDIILVKNDLLDMVKAVQLGRRTVSKIKQNVFWAFLFNALGIPIATGALYPVFGMSLKSEYVELAMIFSSVLVVINSLSLRFPLFLKVDHSRE
ncbi:MAG: hypothetical protein E3K32_04200 [wastewater metagenome]|nr:hypothetical protein [Candidatus Loosdrechtia aerotolerans]